MTVSALGSPSINALPSGAFSSPYPGKLFVTLISTFGASALHDAGFPSSGGSGGQTNVAVQAFAGPSGSPSTTAVVDKYNLTAQVVLDYPGGNAVWPVGVSYVSGQQDFNGGLWTVSMDVQLVCQLQKKT